MIEKCSESYFKTPRKGDRGKTLIVGWKSPGWIKEAAVELLKVDARALLPTGVVFEVRAAWPPPKIGDKIDFGRKVATLADRQAEIISWSIAWYWSKEIQEETERFQDPVAEARKVDYLGCLLVGRFTV